MFIRGNNVFFILVLRSRTLQANGQEKAKVIMTRVEGARETERERKKYKLTSVSALHQSINDTYESIYLFPKRKINRASLTFDLFRVSLANNCTLIWPSGQGKGFFLFRRHFKTNLKVFWI